MDFAAKLKMKEGFSLFRSVFTMYSPVRKCSQYPKGKKYYGFTFFPRNEDFEDPPYEPSKLFLIKRIKPMRGRNPTEKQALELLNIDGEKDNFGHINIVKNIPQVNALLWKVKHLIDLKPITWKGELPKNYSGTYLRDSGELIISPKLEITPEQLEASKELSINAKKPDRQYLKNFLKKKWENGFTGTG